MCSLKYKPQALHTGLPSLLRRHNVVELVEQLAQVTPVRRLLALLVAAALGFVCRGPTRTVLYVVGAQHDGQNTSLPLRANMEPHCSHFASERAVVGKP